LAWVVSNKTKAHGEGGKLNNEPYQKIEDAAHFKLRRKKPEGWRTKTQEEAFLPQFTQKKKRII